MAKGLFINYFETLGLDPADGRSKNYEILTERHNRSAGQLSQEAKYQAGILSRAMEAFQDQEHYEDFLKEIENHTGGRNVRREIGLSKNVPNNNTLNKNAQHGIEFSGKGSARNGKRPRGNGQNANRPNGDGRSRRG